MKAYLSLLQLFIFFSSINCLAQQPGGIPGHKLWLIADKESTLSKKKIKNLTDVKITHFNFNPIVNLQSGNNLLFRNIVSEQYSLFTVFKSDFEDEHAVMTVNRGKTNVLLTNKELLNQREIIYKKVNSRNGFILSYINGNNDKNGKKRNSITIDDLFGQDKEGKEQLMELIYYPTILNDIEREKIQTYLSIKYGISILGDYDYLNSEAKKIWDSKENKVFSNRVTGLGRDDAYGLYQKQSGNSEKDGLYIGLGKVDTTNALNKYNLNDMSFILWGDNAGKKIFTEDKKNRLKKMERIWKMQLSGFTQQDSITTQLKIDKKESIYTNENTGQEYLWLAINASGNSKFDYVNAKYIKQSSEDENYIYFDGVKWDEDGNGTELFTFVKGPDFFIEHKSNLACTSADGAISLKIVGGTPPYTVLFDDKEFVTNRNSYEFDHLARGEHKMKVIESKKKLQEAIIELDTFKATNLYLAPVWYLGVSGEVIVAPAKETSDNSFFSYEWKYGSKIVSIEKQFTSNTPGDYILTVTTTDGCSIDIPFQIVSRSKDLVSGWKLYPNPIKGGENFSIIFNLDKESNVAIRINSMEGKQVLTKSLGKIKDFTFNESVETGGIYLVTVTVGDTSETVKLIVH